VVTLETTPALSHWLPLAASCADDIPNFGIVTDVVSQENLSPGTVDLTLRLGPREESDPFVTVLGQEQFVILAGADVPANTLSVESLQQIYSGNVERWSNLPELENTEEDGKTAIVFGYPPGHELAQFFSQTYLGGGGSYILTQSYSTVGRLTELLQENPSAIAYALASQSPAGVRTLAVTQPDAESIWVLAITPDEPTDGLRQFLLCLQKPQ
jgi:DNA-binding transcriptional LysR family regulator